MLWDKLRRSKNVKDASNQANNNKSSNAGFAAKLGGGLAASAAILAGWLAYGPELPQYVTSQVASEQQDIKVTNFSGHEQQVDFIKAILGAAEDSWQRIFAEQRKMLVTPKLHIFTGSVRTRCGEQDSDVGPFYCPADYKIYIDLEFYDVLGQSLQAPGDAAQAMVIFHEFGHHVQNVMGYLPNTYAKMQRVKNEADKNKMLVRLELQADCFAGIVFNKNKRILESGDVAEIVNAAARIGDNWLQTRGRKDLVAVPDSFTHGTSEQRAAWLLVGYKTGDFKQCDTFKIDDNTARMILKN